MKDLAVYCADIGSISRQRFGWARVQRDAPESRKKGKSIDELVATVSADLACRPVALGFECPLWVPLPGESKALGRSRANEGRHPWSAGAGAAVLATGLVQIPWILERLRAATPELDAYTDWTRFQAVERGLFVWEAFVAGAGKDAPGLPSGEDPDVRDAIIAAELFAEESRHERLASSVQPDEGVDVVSLLGAALLRTGWSSDLALLRRECVVVKAKAGEAGSG